MSHIVDRRKVGDKSVGDRQRFLKRYKRQVKDAVTDAINKRDITDIDKGEDVTISSNDISEPEFGHGAGGIRDYILPGNDKLKPGDKITKPYRGDGYGDKAGNSGTGEDDFIFSLSREEFLEFFFEDMELPDLVKKDLADIKDFKVKRAGYSTAGNPSSVNVIRTMKQATSRRIALTGKYKRKIKELEKKLCSPKCTGSVRKLIEEEIKKLKQKIAATPFIDDFDVRYDNKVKVPNPTTRAVMVMIMDVSGSMDMQKKDLAKRFFILLYLFLKRNYESIEMVFIRYHTEASEVNEEDFFYSRETGGTITSTSLELALDIIKKRYSESMWNIYMAHASDGDNWRDDNNECISILKNDILKLVQYYTYVEVEPRNGSGELWDAFEESDIDTEDNFSMQQVYTPEDIYPAFKNLFKRRGNE